MTSRRFDDFLADFSAKYGKPTDRMARCLQLAYVTGITDRTEQMSELLVPVLRLFGQLNLSASDRAVVTSTLSAFAIDLAKCERA